MYFDCDNEKKTRKSYPTHRKLEEVIHAEEHGFAAAAAIKFETDEPNIRRWKNKNLLWNKIVNFFEYWINRFHV